MKKMIALVLALAMILTMAACGKKAELEETTPTVVVPASALEIFQNVWDAYAEEEKFAVMGGGMENPVDGAPGAFPLDDEAISYALLIPAEQLTNVTEAASLTHMMNANTFTGAVYKRADGVSAADFGTAMRDAVMNNQWMCGFPDSLLIQDIAGAYVLVAFGKNEPMQSLETHLNEVYPDSTVLANETIA